MAERKRQNIDHSERAGIGKRLRRCGDAHEHVMSLAAVATDCCDESEARCTKSRTRRRYGGAGISRKNWVPMTNPR
jgi:hypothetical protein